MSTSMWSSSALRSGLPPSHGGSQHEQSFTDAAIAAGLIKAGETFDVFASDENFVRGATDRQ
jgi:hypothetical protein